MIEALWSVEFVATGNDFGAGVAVFETGRVFGGDSIYYYVGTYTISGGVLAANVAVTHYFGPPSSVFGPRDKFTLELSGTPARNSFTVTGHIVGEPAQQIAIRFTRRAELP